MPGMYTHVYVYTYNCTYTCTCVYVNIYIYIYIQEPIPQDTRKSVSIDTVHGIRAWGHLIQGLWGDGVARMLWHPHGAVWPD